uniref:Uncharacterized protein n=1 Tax=Anguilla anguilla TaxID=7936 RepID=A0A0E9V6T8_ANGAN
MEFHHTTTLPFFKSKHNIFNVHINPLFIVKTDSLSRLLNDLELSRAHEERQMARLCTDFL